MQIECPNCNARYLTPDEQIGPTGRRVRCARCAHVWRVEPPAAPSEDAPAPQPDPIRVEPLPRNRLPAPANAVRRRRGARGWLLFLLIVAALVAAFAFLRAEITAAWPPATKLYEMVDSAKAKLAGISDLKALKIENYKVAPVGEGADAAILLNGDVVNAGDAPVDAPYVRIRLRDADGKVLRDQREPLGDTPLQPGERRSFALRFEHPEDVDTADFPVLEPIR